MAERDLGVDLIGDDADADFAQADEQEAEPGILGSKASVHETSPGTADMDAYEVEPLTPEERAELRRLRAEKAARERRELEHLRAEHQRARQRAEQRARKRAERMALIAEMEGASGGQAPRDAQVAVDADAVERDRIAEARVRGEELMVPDEESLAMPPGQKIVLAVIAVIVVITLLMLFLPEFLPELLPSF